MFRIVSTKRLDALLESREELGRVERREYYTNLRNTELERKYDDARYAGKKARLEMLEKYIKLSGSQNSDLILEVSKLAEELTAMEAWKP